MYENVNLFCRFIKWLTMVNEIRIGKYADLFSKRFKQLSEKLSKAQEDKNSMETDLKQRSNRLDQLKFFLASQSTIPIQDENFIAKHSVCRMPEDIFEMFAGDL